MMTIIIALHVIVCIFLIGIILIQAGRGGGLVEGFQGVESMFGTKTNSFLTRTTTVLSILFFLTCLSLAFLSAKQGKSLMQSIKSQPVKNAATAQQAETKAQGQASSPAQPAAQAKEQEQAAKEPPVATQAATAEAAAQTKAK